MSNPLLFKPRFEFLEERRVLSASGTSSTPNLTPPQTAYENLVQANVVGEYVFYDNSAINGNNPASNAAADAAIDTSKTALLPGQTATVANYTTNAAGINGFMVDIAGLPGNVTASDFAFTVGNSNDPTTWTQLTVQPTVTIRWGQGTQGSARVEFTFPDNTIQNEWLQVTVLADANTGLSANDVFYFGNATGGAGSLPNQLSLISAPATVATTPFATEQPDFMNALGNDYYFFDPLIVETNDGTLISVAEARTEGDDLAVPSIAETISVNGGQTWSPITMLYTIPSFPTDELELGSMVVDQKTGTVFLMFTEDDTSVFITSTANDGQSWSVPQDITSSAKNPSWGWIAPGPGNGIQLTIGPDAGRLMIAVDYRFAAGTGSFSYDAVIYSDNDGTSWQVGGGPDPTNPANEGANEATIVQLSSGAIYMNSRIVHTNNPLPARAYSISYDGGMTWTTELDNYTLSTPSVEGSMIRLDPNTLLFAAPNDPYNTGNRQQMTIWASFNDGTTWTAERVITYDFAGYSDMVALGDDSAMLVFGAGQVTAADDSYQKVELVKFNLAALESTQPTQFTWNFNEQPIGQTAPIGGSSIRDDGPWDERGTVQSTGGVPYYVPGSNGDEALRIVNGSNVNLSPADTDGLQFGSGQSFAFQFVLRTTSANGVLLGEMPGDPGYTFSLVNGAITLNVNDGTNSVTLTGTTIDDGNWHSVVGVRDAQAHTLSLYVDGTLVATAADTTGSLHNYDAVTLGSYADGSGQLTFDIDLLQATRAALTPSQFLTSSYIPPQTLPAPASAASDVLNLPGLALFLPPYDDRHYFSDPNESDPLLIQPAQGTAARSAIDATDNYDLQAPSGGTVHYETSPIVGAYWSSQTSDGWTVADSNGAQSPNNNFDFVQNTETFTISDVFNIPAIPYAGNLVLTGNNSNTTSLPGFDLAVGSDGILRFSITDGTGQGTSLINTGLGTYAAGSTSLPQLSTGSWYQVVIVGNGAGTSLQYYLTPMTATQVQQYQTSKAMTPIATPTATGSTQNLQIGYVGDGFTTTTVPTVNFKDLAIFNQALTPAQVEQLFLDDSLPPVLTPSGATNTFTVGGAAVAVDAGLTGSTEGYNLTGATVTVSSGTLQPGDTLNFTNQNGISGSYSGGMLTLSGNASVAQYQTALQSVTFSTTSTNTTARAISIVAFNEALVSNVAAEQVNVSNTVPVLTASGTTNAFTIGGSAVNVDSGLTGSPSASDLTGATMTISAGTFEPGDTLNFTNQGAISGSYSSGVLILAGNATVAQYQVALRSVTFSTTGTNSTSRAISVVAVDGVLDGSPAIEQLKVILAPPTVIPSGTTNFYLVGSAGVAVDSGITISPYLTDLTGATVTISSATLQPGDMLDFTNQNGISGIYSGGVLALSGNATVGQYQAALQSVTFSSTSTNLTPRSVAIVAVDNTLSSNPVAEGVNVVDALVNPSRSMAGYYTPGASAVYVDSGVTVSSYGGSLTEATVTISTGTLHSGDTLSFTSPSGSGIGGVYSGGVLTLTGTATVAQYQAVLRSITFSNATNVSTAARSISIVAVDGSLDSNTAAEQVNVVAPVSITAAYVSSTSWSSTFLTYLAGHTNVVTGKPYGSATYGYAFQTGSATIETQTLPWMNLNTITVTFSGMVQDVGLGTLALVGGSGGTTPSVTGFTPDGNNTYTWTLSGPLTNNKYVFAIATTGSSFGTAGSTQVVDANGAGISGKFVEGQYLPSGNGLANSTFDFFFDVLPGDANRDATDNSTDLSDIRLLSSGIRSTSSSYNPYYDIIGAATINSTTFALAKPLNGRLAAASPTAPAVLVVGSPDFTALALGSVEAASASPIGTAAISNVVPASSSSASATPAVETISSTSSTGAASKSASTQTQREQHGRHPFAAIDAAVLDFDLADLRIG